MNKKPDWLRVKYIEDPNREFVEEVLKKYRLNTICREANCPNSIECFSRKTATFLILGKNCSRNCSFCNVHHNTPEPVNQSEPEMIARAIKELGLEYAVITSVTRDDLVDGGAGHFAEVIRCVKAISPQTAIEVLIPDLGGDIGALKIITDCFPAVISHNMETVASLYPRIRSEAEYQRSLNIIKNIKQLNPAIHSKSGIMIGLGETKGEVQALFDDLCAVACEFLTIGQYLAPSKDHYPVKEYIHPSLFEEYKKAALNKGFRFVASSPFVRSSYHAAEALA